MNKKRILPCKPKKIIRLVKKFNMHVSQWTVLTLFSHCIVGKHLKMQSHKILQAFYFFIWIFIYTTLFSKNESRPIKILSFDIFCLSALYVLSIRDIQERVGRGKYLWNVYLYIVSYIVENNLISRFLFQRFIEKSHPVA